MGASPCVGASADDDEAVVIGGNTLVFAPEAIVEEETIGKMTVQCPECSKAMFAKIPRELHSLWQCSQDQSCHECEREIDKEDIKYRCHPCKFTYCVGCARQKLGLPSKEYAPGKMIVKIHAGDILLVSGGTNRAGCGGLVGVLADLSIHHAMLCTGPLVLEPLDEDIRPHLEPGVEVWGCNTIESTSNETGQDRWWHSAMTLFSHNHFNHTTNIIGSLSDDGREYFAMEEDDHQSFKILLHPLRKANGGPGIDIVAWAKALDEASKQSKKWTPQVTALVSGVLGKVGVYESSKYPTAEKRSQLIKELRKDWEKPHVCSGVPVSVWQRYFEDFYEDKDEAAKMILKYMPLKTSATAPSMLAKELTKKHWAMQDSFAPGGLAPGTMTYTVTP